MSSNERKKPSFLFALLIMAAVCVVVIVPYMKWGYLWPPPSFYRGCLSFRPACPWDLHTRNLKGGSVLLRKDYYICIYPVVCGRHDWRMDCRRNSVCDCRCGTSDDNTQNFSSGYVYCRSAVRNGVRYFLGTLGTIGIAMSAVGLGLEFPGHDSRSSGQCRVPGDGFLRCRTALIWHPRSQG